MQKCPVGHLLQSLYDKVNVAGIWFGGIAWGWSGSFWHGYLRCVW